jgi:hypothetical protein
MTRPVRRRSWWQVAGVVLAVVLAIAGLAAIGLLVLFVVAMNNMGSNK